VVDQEHDVSIPHGPTQRVEAELVVVWQIRERGLLQAVRR
jgi:hypothetical protein